MPIVGTHGKLEVSTLGQVRNTKTRVPLKFQIDAKGYQTLQYRTSQKRICKQVGTIVLEAFTGLQANGKYHQCNHKDGVKSNNKLTNLEWVTAKENVVHAIATGLWQTSKGHWTQRTGGWSRTPTLQEIRDELEGIQ